MINKVRKEKTESKELKAEDKLVVIIPEISDELALSNVESLFFSMPAVIMFHNLEPYFRFFLRINPIRSEILMPDTKALITLTVTCRRTHALFRQSLIDIRTERLRHIAKLILSAEEKNVEEAVALVKKTPVLLNYSVRATDPKGRVVEGKLLQIAAMAGDFDLKEGLEEKDRGIVERFAFAAGLSTEEIDKQLEVITSEEGDLANKARNEHVIAAVIAFGEAILQIDKEIVKSLEGRFKAFQALCQPIIDQLEKALQPDPDNVITSGYIFDPRIRHDVETWFEENAHRFGGQWSIQSDVFCINGIGKLDNNLSARDAQIVHAGISDFVSKGTIPSRTLRNRDSTSDFFNSASCLGVDFYIGLSGCRVRTATGSKWRWRPEAFEFLSQVKTRALLSSCNVPRKLINHN